MIPGYGDMEFSSSFADVMRYSLRLRYAERLALVCLATKIIQVIFRALI